MNRDWIKYNTMLLKSTSFQRGASYIALITYVLLNAQYKEVHCSHVGIGQFATSYKKLSSALDIPDYTIRRRLLNIQKDGLIKVDNHQHYTLITILYWNTYEESFDNWHKLKRDILNDKKLIQDHNSFAMYLYIMLNSISGKFSSGYDDACDYLCLDKNQINKIMRKLSDKNLIDRSMSVRNHIDVMLTESAGFTYIKKENAKQVQNDSKIVAFPEQDNSNSSVKHTQTYKEEKNKDLKKKEESVPALSEKLSEAFLAKKIAQQNRLEDIIRYISELIDTGVSCNRISDVIDWYKSHYCSEVYNAYTFRDKFYSMAEIMDAKIREQEYITSTKLELELKERQKAEEEAKKVEEFRKACENDKFHRVRITAKGSPKLAQRTLRKMIANNEATKSEVDIFLSELLENGIYLQVAS